MSLWWVQKDQLDLTQIALIENLPLREKFLLLGPPGSGKTNVLLRRAQFVRGQSMPNVLLLTFTRPLTEFVKTGCFDTQGREIFPQKCVTTIESWLRDLYKQHGKALPNQENKNLAEWKQRLAVGAQGFFSEGRIPPYDALFIDEAQDLFPEEIQLIAQWSPVLFFCGDDRQRIYDNTNGLATIRQTIQQIKEQTLAFHYRVAAEICQVADRIMLPQNGSGLAATAQYKGPKPARISFNREPLARDRQIEMLVTRLREQIRVYGDLIKQGDRLGVIVARVDDRENLFQALENDPVLAGKSKIIRAKEDPTDHYDPSFEDESPICILTVKGCKGLEFRAVHWLFADELDHYHGPEHYYTIVTRAKTSLDITYTRSLPQILARAHSESGVTPW